MHTKCLARAHGLGYCQLFPTIHQQWMRTLAKPLDPGESTVTLFICSRTWVRVSLWLSLWSGILTAWPVDGVARKPWWSLSHPMCVCDWSWPDREKYFPWSRCWASVEVWSVLSHRALCLDCLLYFHVALPTHWNLHKWSMSLLSGPVKYLNQGPGDK